MKQEQQSTDSYLIDSDVEMLRLERQAAIYGNSDDLAHLALGPTDRVLDAGCGSGQITRTVATAVPQGKATGIDREQRYIDYARRRAHAEGTPNIAFIEGNLVALPFENDSFDVVWSKHVLQWIAEPAAALAEFARVTRPGGRVQAPRPSDWPHSLQVGAPVETNTLMSCESFMAASRRSWGPMLSAVRSSLDDRQCVQANMLRSARHTRPLPETGRDRIRRNP